MKRPSAFDAFDWTSYLRVTRGVTVSFAFLLPLLALYEIGIHWTGTDFRNSAELSLKRVAGLFGVWGQCVRWLVLAGSAYVALRLLRRPEPVLRLYPLFVLEACAFALLLGPATSLLVSGVGLKPSFAGTGTERVVLSLGAGVYEELVFRFLLLAGLFALLGKALTLERRLAFGIALVASSLAFAGYHHFGAFGEPFLPGIFGFRFAAGLLLGLLFVARGLALCAYLHAFYDILCDLAAGGAIP